jgi:uncharacterized RDD family membrane protein YckC
MLCPKCGRQNIAGGRFCSSCGAQLPLSPGTPAAEPAAAADVYAGFWKRLAAFMLDYVVVVVLAMLAGGVVGSIHGAVTGIGATAGAPGDETAAGLGAVAGLLAWWLYYALMESSDRQGTLGKMALGIRVVDRQGARVSFWRATGRNFGKFLSSLIMGIGYLMAGFTERKQALHDLLADCLVVNRGADAQSMRRGAAAPVMPAWAIVLIVLAAMVLPIGILTAIAIPAYQDMTVRSKMIDAVRVGREATIAVEEYYGKNRVLPRSAVEAGIRDANPRIVQSVNVDPGNGVVRVVLAIPGQQGKSLLFEPRREADGRVVWTCRGDDVQPRYLPQDCRQK